MDKKARFFVAGHQGRVGSAIVRKLKSIGANDIITKTRSECDLTDKNIVEAVFNHERPQYAIFAAADLKYPEVFPADLIYNNIAMQTNFIETCKKFEIKKMLFLGSSCIYPEICRMPIKESQFMYEDFKIPKQWYSIAKIAGIKTCQAYNQQYGTNYISVIPSTVYGKGDAYGRKPSHIISTMIRRFHEAKINEDAAVCLPGRPPYKIDFIYIDDLADACIFLMENYNSSEIINVGRSLGISIELIAGYIGAVVDYRGCITWDALESHSTSSKILDSSKITNLGWVHKTNMYEGLKQTYNYFLENV